ncbi:hypothetical protein [Novosphingobium sp.]|uniref:hypothetical protein n=1 Tax=Novosphingobium sp. TaxID=1874826 RepID=UPI00333F0369
MDDLRKADFEQRDHDADDHAAETDSYHDASGDSGGEAPPPVIGQDERRMQVRAYNYWAGLLGQRRFPLPDRLIAGDIPEFGSNAVLLHFDNGVDDPMVLALGAALAEECGEGQQIGRLSQVPGRSVLSRITDHYLQIIANAAPIGFEAEFVNSRGATILYRGILLPFSTDDRTIDYIYGVINWKELADQRTTDDLLHEIGQALNAAAPTLPRVPGRMLPDIDDWGGAPGIWADGPDLAEPDPIWDEAPAPALDLAPFMTGTTGPALARMVAVGTPAAPAVAEPLTLAEWLETARASALRALANEDRTRQSLYAAIGRAWDFALAADAAPDDFARLVAEAGLVAQDRAPLIPLVKLVFGADYDKTRLTEYATVLGHARRIGLGKGALAEFLGAACGGLKAIVARERALRRAADKAARPATGRTAWAAAARALPVRPLSELPRVGAEFSLVLVRRMEGGDLSMLGEIADDAALLERATRHFAG